MFGVDELHLLVGFALIVAALWPVAGRLALLVPGIVLVWMALPQRAPFIVRPLERESRRDT